MENKVLSSLSDNSVVLGIRFDLNLPEAAPMAPPAGLRRHPPPPPPPAPVVRAPEAQRSFQVFFDFDKSDLTEAARQVIQQAAATIKAGAAVHIVVTGHTDTVGTANKTRRSLNGALPRSSRNLLADGVPGDQIEHQGRWQDRLAGTNRRRCA